LLVKSWYSEGERGRCVFTAFSRAVVRARPCQGYLADFVGLGGLYQLAHAGDNPPCPRSQPSAPSSSPTMPLDHLFTLLCFRPVASPRETVTPLHPACRNPSVRPFLKLLCYCRVHRTTSACCRAWAMDRCLYLVYLMARWAITHPSSCRSPCCRTSQRARCVTFHGAVAILRPSPPCRCPQRDTWAACADAVHFNTSYRYGVSMLACPSAFVCMVGESWKGRGLPIQPS
jgi:hypothetical protein